MRDGQHDDMTRSWHEHALRDDVQAMCAWAAGGQQQPLPGP